MKSALLLVMTHSGALEPNSLFCTTYVPREAGAMSSWQIFVVWAWPPSLLTFVVPAWRPTLLSTRAATPPRTTTASTTTITRSDLPRVKLSLPAIPAALQKYLQNLIIVKLEAPGRRRVLGDPKHVLPVVMASTFPW